MGFQVKCQVSAMADYIFAKLHIEERN